MSNFTKEWKQNDIYNFNVELNRIENYNKYVENWLKTYYSVDINLEHKVDWSIEDIVDLRDINRVINNINSILEYFNDMGRIEIKTTNNQLWTSNRANEIEVNLSNYLNILGDYQFGTNMTCLTVSGDELKLNMGV